MKRVLLILKMLVWIVQCDEIPYGMPYDSPILTAYPCFDSREIVVWYDPSLPQKERNQYYLYANRAFPSNVSIEVKFNADVNAIMTLKTVNNTYATYSLRNGSRSSHQYRTTNPGLLHYGYKVKGTTPGKVPYVTSFKINNVEFCNRPNVGFLDEYVSNTFDAATPLNCGRRKVEHVELIVNGAQTKPGDWPWHTAIYKLQYSTIKYVCGGTLISTHFVLTGAPIKSLLEAAGVFPVNTDTSLRAVSIFTAAHCASARGIPVLAEILSVVLGKYNLIGGDIGSEEREVHRIIIHDQFQLRYLQNDIALLKLKTEVVFTDFIQPACLWYSKASEKLLSDEILGTVVGWGFDNSDTLSRTMKQTQMPMVADSVCMSSNPIFYTLILNNKTFCAGYRNHTSPCNGDSGSAFQVFVPDSTRGTAGTRSSGTWLVRGIVSQTISRDDAPICDPNQYVVFTDVAEYLPWIRSNLDNE